MAKMAKKWCEKLVMEIILFNTKNKRVPKIRLLCVVKKSALRLERANLANFSLKMAILFKVGVDFCKVD